MRQTKKDLKQPESGDEITTPEIKKSVKQPAWRIIGGQKAWIRICPHCKAEVRHHSQNNFYVARKANKKCVHCRQPRGRKNSFFGRKHSEHTRKNYSISRLGERNPMFGLFGKKHPKFGNSSGGVKKHSIESKMKMSVSKRGRFMGNQNPARRPEVRAKIRLSVIKHIEEKIGTGLKPCFNPTACKYIDKLNRSRRWNLHHALKGGEFFVKELGYWVDGFDVKRNIVFEYNEPKHYLPDGSLREKDQIRIKCLKKLLNCRVFIYNERENKLNEY